MPSQCLVPGLRASLGKSEPPATAERWREWRRTRSDLITVTRKSQHPSQHPTCSARNLALRLIGANARSIAERISRRRWSHIRPRS